MNFNLREPSPGDKISANDIRNIVRAIRSLTPIKGPGMKIGRGPNGTTYAAEHAKTKKVESESLPWTFAVTVTNAGQANETRSGGWRNCRMQIGYDAAIDETEGGHYAGTQGELNVNGVYYAEVDVAAKTWDLKVVETNNTNGKVSRSLVPASDFTNNKVNVFIGTVKDNVCTYTIGCIPVVYIYV